MKGLLKIGMGLKYLGEGIIELCEDDLKNEVERERKELCASIREAAKSNPALVAGIPQEVRDFVLNTLEGKEEAAPKQEAAEAEPESEEDGEEEKPAPSKRTRTRRAAAKPAPKPEPEPEEDEDEDDEEENAAPAKPSRGKKPTPVVDDDDDEDEEDDDAKDSEADDDDDEDEEEAPVKPSRAAAKKKPAPADDDEGEGDDDKEDDDGEEITKDALLDFLKKKKDEGYRLQVKKLITDEGVEKFSDVDPSSYAGMYKAAKDFRATDEELKRVSPTLYKKLAA